MNIAIRLAAIHHATNLSFKLLMKWNLKEEFGQQVRYEYFNKIYSN